MIYEASHRFARISPQKVRPLADLIRGKYADDALEILKYQPNRGARMLEKVLLSAVGNANDPNHPGNRGRFNDVTKLWVSHVSIDPGPMFKRIRPRARGMAFGVKKRMSHIRLSLEAL